MAAASNGSRGAQSLSGRPTGKIAFSRALGNGVGSPRTPPYQADIFVMNADGTQQHNVTREPALETTCCVAWSPVQ
jgi:hypothetical protein